MKKPVLFLAFAFVAVLLLGCIQSRGSTSGTPTLSQPSSVLPPATEPVTLGNGDQQINASDIPEESNFSMEIGDLTATGFN